MYLYRSFLVYTCCTPVPCAYEAHTLAIGNISPFSLNWGLSSPGGQSIQWKLMIEKNGVNNDTILQRIESWQHAEQIGEEILIVSGVLG